jgi:hypothetical protein
VKKKSSTTGQPALEMKGDGMTPSNAATAPVQSSLTGACMDGGDGGDEQADKRRFHGVAGGGASRDRTASAASRIEAARRRASIALRGVRRRLYPRERGIRRAEDDDDRGICRHVRRASATSMEVPSRSFQ